MEINKNLLVLSIMAGLAGCGGSDDSSNVGKEGDAGSVDSSIVAPGGDDTSGGNESVNFGIKAWSLDKIKAEMTKVEVVDGNSANLCEAGDNITVETEHFIATFGEKATSKNKDNLIAAARLGQVAFNELMAQTDFKMDDLDFSKKWTICYNDNMSGHGSGLDKRFDFSPKSVDPAHQYFERGYWLAKHELVHVFASEIVGYPSYSSIPRWFNEGIASILAGSDAGLLPPTVITDYVTDTNVSPYTVESWSEEQKFPEKYRSNYKVYVESLAYLGAHGLTNEMLVQLLRDAAKADFNSAFSTLENSLTLPTSLTQLKLVEVYEEAMLKWMEPTTSYQPLIGKPNAVLLDLYVENEDGSFSYDETDVTADQSQYVTRGVTFPNGTYNVYASSETLFYGPIKVTAINGTLGKLDFTNAPIFIDSDD
ncbi:hypothetical protein C0W88_06615 [Photobacterium leiognathi subsp. mandapamensis]|uniref:hypothetical protein n=1 Tax=Photobacterium leiognathi TaxID=553611 RepID=UPI000D1511A3|nr:hypothetical protein [Photobacterium leiognathi]PSW66046.1 hypothetical protein C0W88_06615 [Photobacterium leiognathi subsp. mandapamensis]